MTRFFITFENGQTGRCKAIGPDEAREWAQHDINGSMAVATVEPWTGQPFNLDLDF